MRQAGAFKLLMTADAVGGIWTYALDLGHALRGRGAEVTLAVLGPGLDAARRQAAAVAGLGLVDLGHPPEWLAAGAAEVEAAGAALAGLAAATGADLVHLNHPSLGGVAPIRVPTVAVCHSCVATWWAAVRGTPLPAELAWQADLVGAGYRAATTLVAPSHAFAAATQAAYGLPRTPEVVHNGRAAEPAVATPGEPARRALTVGRLWDEGKDVLTLDRAAALTDVAIQAAGPATGPNGTRVDVARLDMLGPMAEAQVRHLMAARPIYLSAARYEPFGLSVLEAAQAGCALVLGDIPTLRELWSEAALFVPPGDAARYAGALDALVADPASRARYADAARRRAATYSLDAQASRMAGLYARLLGRSQAGPDAA